MKNIPKERDSMIWAQKKQKSGNFGRMFTTKKHGRQIRQTSHLQFLQAEKKKTSDLNERNVLVGPSDKYSKLEKHKVEKNEEDYEGSRRIHQLLYWMKMRIFGRCHRNNKKNSYQCETGEQNALRR